MATATDFTQQELAARTVFSRVIAGVDGSEPGYEAARQAARLAADDGWLEVFTAVYLVESNLAGWSASKIRAELEREAGEAVRKGTEIAGPHAESRLVNGPPLSSLARELTERNATLAVVGTHGHSRWSEIVLGGVAGELLHKAPCSVCIARAPTEAARFPRAIVAGVDGSAQSEVAVMVARHLALRFGVPLTLLTALGGKDVDAVHAAALGSIARAGHPVETLVEAGNDADILVLGSRGLNGLRALGSVSERVAHRARCSVLVVRGTD